jgi:hypothetical protein
VLAPLLVWLVGGIIRIFVWLVKLPFKLFKRRKKDKQKDDYSDWDYNLENYYDDDWDNLE